MLTNDEDTMRTNTLKKFSDNNDSAIRRSGRQRIANQRYEYYELYVTAEEVEKEKDRDNGVCVCVCVCVCATETSARDGCLQYTRGYQS
jgi:hypothetical protein